MDSHTALARRLGATDAQLAAALGAPGDGADALAPAARAAVRYAAEMTGGGGPVSDACFTELSAHWAPPQIVEITAVVGLFNYFNRFAGALAIPPTR